jgi:ABC-type uncharacterized transport system fused permease/ATPase subunit
VIEEEIAVLSIHRSEEEGSWERSLSPGEERRVRVN